MMVKARISNLLGKIAILIVISCCSLSAQGKYGGGSGTPEDPYQIWDASHMQAIGADANDWDKHFVLMADVDLGAYTGEEFNIIGYYVSYSNKKPFAGVFDGNGRTISNFSYTSPGKSYVGVFGYVRGDNAKIKDLGLIEPNVDAGTHGRVGSLVGGLREATITNCYAERGSVSGNELVGGLVGYNYSGTITKCDSSGDVDGNSAIGGLVGCSWDYSTITSCFSSGNVAGNGAVGGLVGFNYESAL